MEERWATIEEFDGIEYGGDYEISSLGRLKSLKKAPRILKPCITDEGYVTTVLSKNAKTKHVKLHRLVATYFVWRDEGKNVVNHKDRNKSNNVYTNLEWVTQSENGRHGMP